MPANNREQKLRAEAQFFCKTKSLYPIQCKHFEPTLKEVQSTTFSDYVRNTVLRKCEEDYEDDDEDEPEIVEERHDTRNRSTVEISKSLKAMNRKINYDYGIAKVTLPEGFSNSEGIITMDSTGRGDKWKSGTKLGDMMLPSPMTQVVNGIGGIYEFTFLDNEPLTVSEFREKADKYIESQLGRKKDDSIEVLERKFWKRLGPTMQSSMYGADMDGSLFDTNDACEWNIAKLQSCLQLLLIDQKDDNGGIPGVTTPYLYFGMWASVFCAHTEDMNLLSINYLHAGAPKIWYAIAEGEDSRRFENFMETNFHHAKKDCPEYLRHKRSLISPAMLKKAGIPYTSTVQYPGDAIITFPGSYHFGFNAGFNVAEATNFAVPEWIPYGKVAKVCNCRPDSVRMDVEKFERLLLRYENEVLQTKRVSWKDWAEKVKKKRIQEEMSNASYGSSPNKKLKNAGDSDEKTSKASKPKDFWVEVVQPLSKKSTKKSKSKKSRKNTKAEDIEIWHLAKPIGRKSLRESDRVLCIIPAVTDIKNDENESEECFAGYIFERMNDDVRIRLDGMGKKDDIWMSVNSSKLFVDGGRWEEDNDFKMPAKHYWKEEDFSQKCN